MPLASPSKLGTCNCANECATCAQRDAEYERSALGPLLPEDPVEERMNDAFRRPVAVSDLEWEDELEMARYRQARADDRRELARLER